MQNFNVTQVIYDLWKLRKGKCHHTRGNEWSTHWNVELFLFQNFFAHIGYKMPRYSKQILFSRNMGVPLLFYSRNLSSTQYTVCIWWKYFSLRKITRCFVSKTLLCWFFFWCVWFYTESLNSNILHALLYFMIFDWIDLTHHSLLAHFKAAQLKKVWKNWRQGRLYFPWLRPTRT